MNTTSVKIALVDDHPLFREGIKKAVLKQFKNAQIVFEAENGKEALQALHLGNKPDVLLMDLNMPILDGFELLVLIKKEFPEIKVLALTMLQDDETLIRLIKLNVNGYVNKAIDPQTLELAIETLLQGQRFYDERMLDILSKKMNGEIHATLNINDIERTFLRLLCADYSYKMMADEMCKSIKTIDGYRAKLFEKCEVQSKTGLALFALKANLVRLEDLN